jgi:hypothetical protein
VSAESLRRLLAEAIGTAILVLFGAGSVVAALTLGDGTLDYASLGMVAITFALAIALAIYAFGNTSGAHLNPAVTVSLAAVKRFPWSDVPAYVGAQLAGGVVGAALIVAAFGGDAVDLGTGQTSIAAGTSYAQAIVAEAVGTFLADGDHGAGGRQARARRLGGLDDRPRGGGRNPADRPPHGRITQSCADVWPAGREHNRRRRHLLG